MLSTIFFYFEMICYCCLTWYGSGHSLFVVFHPLEVNQQYLSGLGEMYCIKSKNRILNGSKQQVCLILLLMDFFRCLWYGDGGKKLAKSWHEGQIWSVSATGLGKQTPLHCQAKQTIEKIWRKIQVRFNVAYNFLHYYGGPPAGHFPVRRRGTARVGNAGCLVLGWRRRHLVSLRHADC